MRVVVTGAEGFLGRRVVARMAAEGHSVVAVDRIAHAGPALDGVLYHVSDLSDPCSLFPLLARRSQEGEAGCPCPPYILVHLAWDMRRHLGFAAQAEQVRLLAGLLDHGADHALTRVVAMGSAEEYGGCAGVIGEEEPPVLPLSPYGWAKRSAHDLAASWSRRSGVPVVWLRPFIIYGPGQGGDMMIPYAVRCAREGRSAEFTDGKQQRDFVHVDDVAAGIARAVTADVVGFQSCNLGRGEPVAVRDVLNMIADRFGAGPRFHVGARARRPGEPDQQVAETTRSKTLLGWSANIGWREGIAALLDTTMEDAENTEGQNHPVSG